MDKRVLAALLCVSMAATAFATTGFLAPRGGLQSSVDDSTNGQETNQGLMGSQLRAGDYRIVMGERGSHVIEMLDQSYHVLDSPGNPALPEKIVSVHIPSDIDWQSVKLSVDGVESVTLSGSYDVAPVLFVPKATCSGEMEQANSIPESGMLNGKNMNTYGNDANYPDQVVKLLAYTTRKEQGVQGFEDANYVRYAYRPFQYNPVRGELTLTKQVNVHINYDRLGQGSVSPMVSSTYDYVIVTTNDIVDNSERLGNFIHLKETEGHSVKVVTEDDYGGLTGQAPNGMAEKIRQWLRDNYVTLGIDYVLLIGNPDPDDTLDPADSVGDIPMKMMWPNYESWGYRNSPTDYFFADLSGNWDLDGDRFFGEGLAWDRSKSPDPSIDDDTFSAEWNGKVKTDFNENYEFRTYSDDGVKLYIDGTPVIDNWVEHPPTDDGSGAMLMTVGKHSIKLRFRENTGDGMIRLHWLTTGSDHVGDSIIPADHLYDMSDVVGGLDVTYYDNADFTGTTVTRKDSKVDFLWMTGDRGPGGVDSGADVFVGRIPVYDDNYSQLDDILHKTIRYETEPGDISWRESILLPMKPLWPPSTPSYTLGEGIKNDIAVPSAFSYYRIYDEDFGVGPEKTPCEAAYVKEEWKNGYGMVVWSTHGSPGGASHVFDYTMTGELDDSKPSLTFQGSCNNGYPEEPNNLGYSLLKRGAVATVSASRVSWEYYGNWTFDPLDAANHNLAYHYTKRIVIDGSTTGASLYLTKGSIADVERNMMDYNLYGDPDLYFLTTMPNLPPVATSNGPYVAVEGSTVTFDATGSYDPEGDSLEYRWDIDNDGTWDTGWSASPTTSYTWGDDYTGQAKVEVRDELGFTGSDVADVSIVNVEPTIGNVRAYVLVDFALRVAGEKWHNVEMYIHEDGVEIGYAEVVRYPGSPDDQAVTLSDIECDMTKSTTVTVLYTPDDDPVNGQPNGASPAWVNMSFEDGDYVLLHHTFNVMHSDTWEWVIGVNQLLVGAEITFEADASDPGSDDLTFTWDWDDGTPATATSYYNDGVGPDPYPSTGGTFPFTAADMSKHAFAATGTYDVNLTVEDDDGGLTELIIVIIIV